MTRRNRFPFPGTLASPLVAALLLWPGGGDDDGTPAVAAFRVNVQEEGSHRYPGVLAVPAGWVVIWRHDGVQPRGLQVNATRLSLSGGVLGVTPE